MAFVGASLLCYKQQQTDSRVEGRVIEGEETQTHTDTEKMTSVKQRGLGK